MWNAKIRMPFRIALLMGLSLALTALPDVSHGQGIDYTFTRIADTASNDSGLSGPGCVGLNDLGTVIVTFNPVGALNRQLWRGNGQTFEAVAPVIGTVCASINDLDETAYAVPDPATGQATLVKNGAGAVTPLASSSSAPYLFVGDTYLPSLNNAGSAVFQSRGVPGPGTGAGIYIGPSGTAVYNASTDTQLLNYSTASMNDSSVVAFIAIRPDATAPSGSRVGIYSGSAVPLIEDGSPTNLGPFSVALRRPVINNLGTVAFLGAVSTVSNSFGVYTTLDGVSVTRVGTFPLDRIAINDAGTVAFRRGDSQSEGIFVGRPGSPDEKVIATGDELDGSVFLNGFIWEEGINSFGQVAFFALLADGRQGVYRADPDTTPPVVNPPAPTVVEATEPSGATARDSSALAAFLAGGTAADAVDPNPTRLTPQVNGTDVTDTTLFPLGASTVTFRFQDRSGNIGTSTSEVVVTEPAVIDLDIAQFRVTGRLAISRGGAVDIKLTIKNNGSTVAAADATVVGIQGDTQVYSATMSVSDPVGNGKTTVYFPPFVPSAAQNIIWNVTINDSDPDVDIGFAETTIVP